MAFFSTKEQIYKPRPIPSQPSYQPPIPPTPPIVEQGSDPINPRPIFSGECDIYFYITDSENEKVDKNLTEEIKFTISLKNDTDYYNPNIRIETDTNLLNYNYAKLLDKYYFITNKELLTGNIYNLILKEDVLMTWRDSIREQSAIIDKQETSNYDVTDVYIDDGSWKVSTKQGYQMIMFPNGFEEGTANGNVLIGMG